MLIKWEDSYSVNVKELDDQHKKFIDTVNQLYFIINKGGDIKEEFAKTMEKLINFKDVHFSTEEKYFKEFNYENTEEHVNEHNELKKQLMEFYKKLSGPNSEKKYHEMCFSLLDFLEDWFLSHLSNEDKKYVETFNKKGLF